MPKIIEGANINRFKRMQPTPSVKTTVKAKRPAKPVQDGFAQSATTAVADKKQREARDREVENLQETVIKLEEQLEVQKTALQAEVAAHTDMRREVTQNRDRLARAAQIDVDRQHANDDRDAAQADNAKLAATIATLSAELVARASRIDALETHRDTLEGTIHILRFPNGEDGSPPAVTTTAAPVDYEEQIEALTSKVKTLEERNEQLIADDDSASKYEAHVTQRLERAARYLKRFVSEPPTAWCDVCEALNGHTPACIVFPIIDLIAGLDSRLQLATKHNASVNELRAWSTEIHNAITPLISNLAMWSEGSASSRLSLTDTELASLSTMGARLWTVANDLATKAGG